MSNEEQSDDFEPSKLGTKDYWDSIYTTELTNHAANPSDTGTSWFEESNAEEKTISLLESCCEGEPLEDKHSTSGPQSRQGTLSKDTTSFLDLGCGNGSLLFALQDEGWLGPMKGVDYSEKSIHLAQNIAKSRDHQSQECISFETYDILSTTSSPFNPPIYDVLLDKGTFDAISLNSTPDPVTGKRGHELYAGRILRLVKEGGLFVITSCNWTEEELVGWFETATRRVRDEEGGGEENGGKGWFAKVGQVEYPSLQFGGVKGQTISTVCFQKMGEASAVH